MQRGLDTNIAVEKNLDTSTLFTEKVIALLVELAEAINEWRSFKFWSNDQIPREEELLEELVDCIHFALSIGNDMRYEKEAIQFISLQENDFEPNIKRSILSLFRTIIDFEQNRSSSNYLQMFQSLIDLILELGFSWEDVEMTYDKKNRINHLRQIEGY